MCLKEQIALSPLPAEACKQNVQGERVEEPAFGSLYFFA
jgi:hypothetical protein